jgi:AraC-like DNA-binding protein
MRAAPHDMPSIESLAEHAGYSPAHFSRVFKTVMGVSPQQHLMQARIDRATQLLLETDWSINRIAQVLGYNDVFFFSRQFKRVTGKTPTAIRRS